MCACVKTCVTELFLFSVANPFGASSTTSVGTQGSGTQHSANPFGGQPGPSTAGFGAFGSQGTAPAGFGTPASTAGAGFGQFGAPGTSANAAGFGQFNMQNGGFGANTSAAGFGGVQTSTQGFGAQQGFSAGQPGFGQPQAAGFGAGFGGQGFGQPQAGFGSQPAQMQGFGGAPATGGWGQMPASSGTPAVNPFMVRSEKC